MTQGAEAEACSTAHLVEDRWSSAYLLTEVPLRIGRDASSEVVVRDATASRRHAEIRCEGGAWVLHAMGSSGTRLNGRQVGGPTMLAEGDVIEVAATRLRFTKKELPEGITPATHASVSNAAFTRETTEIRERLTLDGFGRQRPILSIKLYLGIVVLLMALVTLVLLGRR
ncbi:MAG: domain containing protein [Gemmatimonadetes bacterium]|nr:domain containing protein [Gemmatimonadota bacterium]